MKKMILFSSLLMISALLYGAIDFLFSGTSGKLNGLYEPVSHSQNVVSENSKSGRVSYANTNSFQAKQVVKKEAEKKINLPRQVSFEKFSRAALVEMPEIDSLQIAIDSANIVLTAATRIPNAGEERKQFVDSDLK